MEFVERRELAPFLTFQPSKTQPIYNWFYYKEAFSPELVRALAKELELKEIVLDPFCGVGTTLLACKELRLRAVGFDVNPLCVLASRVKTRDYNIASLKTECARVLNARFFKPRGEWRFELFPPTRAFPRGSFEEALFLKQKIAEVEDDAAREFLLLALVASLPEASFVMKDGGVLRIVKGKKKHVPPLKQAFARRARRMLEDLKHAPRGPVPLVAEGDARALPFSDESISAIVCSPPYLNNVDYTKVYGLELSLLYGAQGEKELKKIRARSIRSFAFGEFEFKESELAPAVLEALEKIKEANGVKSLPVVVATYFQDLFQALGECKRVLRAGGVAAFAVGNAVLPGLSIDVDEATAFLGECLGFRASVWVCARRWADVGIPKKQPVRESVVILEKGK